MGRFKKGEPRPQGAGIKKGGKWHKSRVEEACEKAAAGRGCDPFLIMAEIATDPEASIADRLAAAKALSKFLEPEKKAVEITGEMEHGITVKILDYQAKG